MKVITIGNTKGGVGKSTITANLAVAAARDSKSVIIIDSDVQKSSMDFRNIRKADDITAVSVTTPTLHKDIASFTKSHDLIFIDAGGRDSATFRSAIMASDLFVIPLLPSVYDLWAAEETLALLRECRGLKDVRACLLINQMQQHTNMAREAIETLDALAAENDCPVFASRLFHRTAYKSAIVGGQGVIEFEARGKAAYEVKILYGEILALLKNKGGRK